MKLAQAQVLAEWIRGLLSPYCDRCEIAGSIRREKPDVGDIEIVCIPREVKTGLFGFETERDLAFVEIVEGFEKVRGSAFSGRYTQRIVRPDKGCEIKLDLFMTKADNWGNIFAIRTGSADFSRQILARRWVQLGYHSINGRLHKGNTAIELREEQDLFDLLGLAFVDPKCRGRNE